MSGAARRTRVVILGAAGRDFHNFNVAYRDDPGIEVVAFTAAQIPGIADRRYPPVLSGRFYPRGIPIRPESELEMLVAEHSVDEVVFAYSDVPHGHVMGIASRALAAGADFSLLGPERTMLKASVPVIAVSAVRTGCGKSQVSRYLACGLRGKGLRVAVIRHPMPYGDLAAACVQRFGAFADLDAAHCTLEEREEYEPHVAAGNVVFAGVDYAATLERAQEEAEMIVWDGGNNDSPFLRPDLHIVLVDALRPGHETGYHPGEAVLRMADVIVIAKADAALPADVDKLANVVRAVNARATVVRGASPITLDDAEEVRGKRVLLVEDGPTLTHGGMAHGAAYALAMRAGAVIVDPRPSAAPGLAQVYAQYPHIGPVLPAMGYSEAQIAALQTTLNAADAELVIAGTPIDLRRAMKLEKPVRRARYEFAELEHPGVWGLVERFLESREKQV